MSDPFEKARLSATGDFGEPRLLSEGFWDEVRIFLAVAKAGSFNRAAGILDMTQPTVSKQVYHLQDRLGVQLIKVGASGIVLTEKGDILAKEAMAMDARLFEISHGLKAGVGEAEGLVRVTATEALSSLFIAPAMVDFNNRYPAVQLQMQNVSSMTSFADNHCDVFLGYAPSREPGIVSEPVGFMHLVPMVSSLYCERHGVPTLQNLEQHALVDANYYTGAHEIWRTWRAIAGRCGRVHFSENSICYAMMVKAHMGIGLLGSYALADTAAIPLDLGCYIRLPLFVLASQDSLKTRTIKIVRNWVIDIFRDNAACFGADLNIPIIPKERVTEIFHQVRVGTALDDAAL